MVEKYINIKIRNPYYCYRYHAYTQQWVREKVLRFMAEVIREVVEFLWSQIKYSIWKYICH